MATADYQAGVRQITIPSSERGADLDVTIWYPAGPGGTPVLLGETPFFEGASFQKDAPSAPGRFPLIVMSHGAGLAGRAEAMGWMAKPLAAAGFVVAAPTHPGNTGPDRSAAETMKLWLRPSDLSETLDTLETAEAFAEHVDFDRIGVLGLSMGGNTALAIAGARIDPDLLASSCDSEAGTSSLCDWIRVSGVDLHAMDMGAAGRSNADPRVRWVMAIDPALVDVFARQTFADIAVPVALVNLGPPETMPDTMRASEIAEAIPNATYQIVEDASHMSMFGLCKPDAEALAAQNGIKEAICEDGGGRPREAIHGQLAQIVTDAFTRHLDGTP